MKRITIFVAFEEEKHTVVGTLTEIKTVRIFHHFKEGNPCFG